MKISRANRPTLADTRISTKTRNANAAKKRKTTQASTRAKSKAQVAARRG